MPVKLPNKRTWARFAEERGYPPSKCDQCGRETRILHQKGSRFVCGDCLHKLGDVRAAARGER